MDSQPSFFTRFPQFDYDPEETLSVAFRRLAIVRKWKYRSRTWRKNWRLCLKTEYERLIGARVSKLEVWQRMCQKVGIHVLPSIRKCKKVGRHFDWLEIIILLTFLCVHRPCRRSTSTSSISSSAGAPRKPPSDSPTSRSCPFTPLARTRFSLVTLRS